MLRISIIDSGYDCLWDTLNHSCQHVKAGGMSHQLCVHLVIII